MDITKPALVSICFLIVLFGIYIYYLFFGIAFQKKNILKDRNRSIFHDIENTPPRNIMLKPKIITDCDCH